MDTLWQTLGRGRDEALARGLARTRETGAAVLGRAEQRAGSLAQQVAARRSSLNGNAIERLERGVLVRLEAILDRMGLGLRAQIRRLTPNAAASARAASPARKITKKRMRIEVRDVPAAEAKEAHATSATQTPKSATPKRATKSAASKSARPSARPSTRWVRPNHQVIEELAGLSAKALAARVPALDEDERRALLLHERANKNRKSVLAALAARVS